MPLIECPDCHNQISDAAPACPKCGRPNDKKNELPPEDKRTISIKLMTGIVIAPIIFSWFTLKKGYSTTARVLSFVWLLLTLIVVFSGESKNAPEQATPAQTEAAQPSELSADVKPPAPAEPAPVEPAKPVPAVTFGLTPDAFKTKFNRIIKKVSPDFTINKITVTDGLVSDSFIHEFSKKVAISGMIDKTSGNIKNLIFVTTGSDDGNEVLLAMSVSIAMAQTVNPDENVSVLSDAVINMLTDAGKNISTGKVVEKQFGNVEYTASASKELGLMLIISPKESVLASTGALKKSLTPWQPISISNENSRLTIKLPQPQITNTMYKNIIPSGVCSVVWDGADLPDVKSVLVVNEFGKQGYIFEGGTPECKEMGELSGEQSSIYLLGKTRQL